MAGVSAGIYAKVKVQVKRHETDNSTQGSILDFFSLSGRSTQACEASNVSGLAEDTSATGSTDDSNEENEATMSQVSVPTTLAVQEKFDLNLTSLNEVCFPPTFLVIRHRVFNVAGHTL